MDGLDLNLGYVRALKGLAHIWGLMYGSGNGVSIKDKAQVVTV